MKATNTSKTTQYVQLYKPCVGYPTCDFDECNCGSGPVGESIKVVPGETKSISPNSKPKSL